MSYSLFGYQVLNKPKTIEELIHKTEDLFGKTLGEIAASYGLDVPESLKSNRGWIGNLIELALGTDVGSKAQQDFFEFNVELKTVSIDKNFKSINDTFVSMLPTKNHQFQVWENSHVAYKLQNVLFVFIESAKDIPIIERKLISSYLWIPSAKQLEIMKDDWNNIMDALLIGDFSVLNTNIGDILCIKTKGKNKEDFVMSYDGEGNLIKIPPLAFYIKKSFITKLIHGLI